MSLIQDDDTTEEEMFPEPTKEGCKTCGHIYPEDCRCICPYVSDYYSQRCQTEILGFLVQQMDTLKAGLLKDIVKIIFGYFDMLWTCDLLKYSPYQDKETIIPPFIRGQFQLLSTKDAADLTEHIFGEEGWMPWGFHGPAIPLEYKLDHTNKDWCDCSVCDAGGVTACRDKDGVLLNKITIDGFCWYYSYDLKERVHQKEEHRQKWRKSRQMKRLKS